jgi:hypothetical protein
MNVLLFRHARKLPMLDARQARAFLEPAETIAGAAG